MTNGILSAAEDWTGYRPISCPWQSFYDPLVSRVLDVFVAFEDGNLEFVSPSPSHRLVQGLLHFKRVNARITHAQIDMDRKEAQQRQAQGR